MKITKNELKKIIQEVAEEMGLLEGLTAAQEKLPEPLKKAILKKQGDSDESDETADDVDEGLTAAQEKLPEPLKKAILKKQGNTEESDDDSEEESIEEGNAFGAAVKAARENGDKEFEVAGKKYKLKEKVELTEQEDTEEFTGDDSAEDDDVDEGNAFGDAVSKAKEDGDTEFEVDGKTYKVKEETCVDCGESVDTDHECTTENTNTSGGVEIKVDGVSYLANENWTKITLAEKLERLLGNRKIL
jgi:hypothetical protein